MSYVPARTTHDVLHTTTGAYYNGVHALLPSGARMIMAQKLYGKTKAIRHVREFTVTATYDDGVLRSPAGWDKITA